MDIRTLILALAIGNLVFGLGLLLHQLRVEEARRNRCWTAARLLQGTGWALLGFRGSIPFILSFTVGNACLVGGFACESWALLRVAGRPVGLAARLGAMAAILAACVAATPLAPSARIAVASFASVPFFALSAWAMLGVPGPRSPIRSGIGWAMAAMAAVVAVRGVWAAGWHGDFGLFTDNGIQVTAFLLLYVLLPGCGFGMLILSKEAAEREIQALSKEQQAILDTLPTGLCVLKDRVIERCNPAMEAMFGYAPGTLAGRSVRVLFDCDEAFAAAGRRIYGVIEREGRFVGEVEYVRRDGERFWALDHGTTIFPERAAGYAVFSITDIGRQKAQERLLTRQKEELERIVARVRRLEGILQICMYCKKIRNSEASWEQLEKYLTENSDAQLSHGICPECMDRNFPGVGR